MKYKISKIDNDNLKWFLADNTVQTLQSMKLNWGKLRGLISTLELNFSYPISAIAGKNGSGKSTILAMAACGFHNKRTGYIPPGRTVPYYTFKDFFIQSPEEIPQDGISISYGILHDAWRDDTSGLRYQYRTKKICGRWNDYRSRVRRNVIYHGIQRVVPHYERSAHRSYSRVFSPHKFNDDILNKIKEIAGRIIGKSYDNFNIFSHSKYRLPMVISNNVNYSGFNMGAGETAVFEILLTLFEAGNGTLLIIDEIELGLHEKAQKALIQELKSLCNTMHCQIICSTHSPVILDGLPPYARFYIESSTDRSIMTQGISSKYACGKLSGKNSRELDIFVEDDVAESILLDVLPMAERKRVSIIHIGSKEAVLRQLAAHYRENNDSCIAVLDGDAKAENGQQIIHVKKYLEKIYRESEDEVNKWTDSRLRYLPGDSWPEKSLIQEIQQNNCCIKKLSLLWTLSLSELKTCFKNAENAGKHNEFHHLSEELEMSEDKIRTDICRIINDNSNFFKEIRTEIISFLEKQSL